MKYSRAFKRLYEKNMLIWWCIQQPLNIYILDLNKVQLIFFSVQLLKTTLSFNEVLPSSFPLFVVSSVTSFVIFKIDLCILK